MPEHKRDPYAPPPPPREHGGLMVRFAIVAVLLGAAAWAYMTYSQGPGLTQEAKEERPAGAVADASGTRGYTAPRATIPETTPLPEAPSATPPPAEPPPPTSTTIPPA